MINIISHKMIERQNYQVYHDSFNSKKANSIRNILLKTIDTEIKEKGCCFLQKEKPTPFEEIRIEFKETFSSLSNNKKYFFNEIETAETQPGSIEGSQKSMKKNIKDFESKDSISKKKEFESSVYLLSLVNSLKLRGALRKLRTKGFYTQSYQHVKSFIVEFQKPKRKSVTFWGSSEFSC